jgi:hypothetical protein
VGTEHIYLNPVRSERADDFERFLRDTVVPAVMDQRPHLAGRWRVLRAMGANNGVVTYAFVFDGGSLQEDWELDNLLPAHLGGQRAAQLLAEWQDTFAPLQGWLEALAREKQPDEIQVGWSFEQVPL